MSVVHIILNTVFVALLYVPCATLRQTNGIELKSMCNGQNIVQAIIVIK